MTPKALSRKKLRSPDGDPDPQCKQLIRESGDRVRRGFSDTTGERIQARSEARVGCFELPFRRRNHSSASWKAPRVLDLCNWRGQHIED